MNIILMQYIVCMTCWYCNCKNTIHNDTSMHIWRSGFTPEAPLAISLGIKTSSRYLSEHPIGIPCKIRRFNLRVASSPRSYQLAGALVARKLTRSLRFHMVLTQLKALKTQDNVHDKENNTVNITQQHAKQHTQQHTKPHPKQPQNSTEKHNIHTHTPQQPPKPGNPRKQTPKPPTRQPLKPIKEIHNHNTKKSRKQKKHHQVLAASLVCLAVHEATASDAQHHQLQCHLTNPSCCLW